MSTAKKPKITKEQKSSIKQWKDKLPKDFKAKWVKALRSGKYPQGTEGFLRSINEDAKGNSVVEYCCLGVACHIAGSSGITGKSFIMNENNSIIKSINKVPKMLHGDEAVALMLSEINDSGVSFKEIADFVEKYL